MTKTEAILWCELFLTEWPRDTQRPAPNEWRWVIKQRPYQLPEYFLVSLGNIKKQRITKKDVGVLV